MDASACRLILSSRVNDSRVALCWRFFPQSFHLRPYPAPSCNRASATPTHLSLRRCLSSTSPGARFGDSGSSSFAFSTQKLPSVRGLPRARATLPPRLGEGRVGRSNRSSSVCQLNAAQIAASMSSPASKLPCWKVTSPSKSTIGMPSGEKSTTVPVSMMMPASEAMWPVA
jgi:hypothetical protein